MHITVIPALFPFYKESLSRFYFIYLSTKKDNLYSLGLSFFVKTPSESTILFLLSNLKKPLNPE